MATTQARPALWSCRRVFPAHLTLPPNLAPPGPSPRAGLSLSRAGQPNAAVVTPATNCAMVLSPVEQFRHCFFSQIPCPAGDPVPAGFFFAAHRAARSRGAPFSRRDTRWFLRDRANEPDALRHSCHVSQRRTRPADSVVPAGLSFAAVTPAAYNATVPTPGNSPGPSTIIPSTIIQTKLRPVWNSLPGRFLWLRVAMHCA
jgi:hypothetical protein